MFKMEQDLALTVFFFRFDAIRILLNDPEGEIGQGILVVKKRFSLE